MKKLLVITTALMTAGLTLPSMADNHRQHRQAVKVSSNGYSKSKGVRHIQKQQIEAYKLQVKLQKRLAALRELERRQARERLNRRRPIIIQPRTPIRCR